MAPWPNGHHPQDPVTMLILSPPPTSLLPRAAVTITSGPHHLGNPRHPRRGRPFSLIPRSPSPESRPSLPPEGSHHPTAFPGPLSALPTYSPQPPCDCSEALPPAPPETPARRGRRVKDSAGRLGRGAGPRPRSLFMNGGAGGARPHYYAARRALRPSATHPLAGRATYVTEPVAGGGAGRGDSRRFSRGRGGFSGSAHTLRRPDPSRASPRPGHAESREVSRGPRAGTRRPEGHAGCWGTGSADRLPAAGRGRRSRPGAQNLG